MSQDTTMRVVLEGNFVRGNFWAMLDMIEPQTGVGRKDIPPDWSAKANLLLLEGPQAEYSTQADIVRKACKEWGNSMADESKYTISFAKYRTNPIGNGVIAFFRPR